MTPRPLCQIRLRWREHRSALWWLGLLYRRPAQFRGALETCSMPHKLISASCLWLHSLPYVLSLSVIGRYLAFGIASGIAPGIASGIAGGIISGIASGIAGGIASGIAFGIACGIAVGITCGIAFGIVYGISPEIVSRIVLGIAPGIAVGIIYGIATGIASGIIYGIAGEIAEGIAVGIASGIASGIAIGIAFGIAFEIAFGIAALRCYYHVAHLFFVWPKARGHWYVYHPLVWDDCCLVPFPELDRLLVAYAEQSPDAGATEIDRLIDSYPSQRRAALRARTRALRGRPAA